MAVVIKVNGVDKTSDIERNSVRWSDNLTNRVNTFEFSVRGQSLPFALALNDEIVMSIDGVNKFGGRVISMEDTVNTENELYASIALVYSW